MTIALYFKRAFQQLGIEVKSVGHQYIKEMPWGVSGINLPQDIPDFPLPLFKNVNTPADWLDIAYDFDLVINFDAAHWFQGKSHRFKKIIVGTDPHACNYDGQRQDCDIFACMQKCYSKPGDIWLPYAYDVVAHRMESPLRVFGSRSTDVAFVGCQHQSRREDLDAIEKSGLRVVRVTGDILDNYSPHYWMAKVGYATPTMNDLPARFFENMAVGAPPVTREVPDIKELGAEPWVHYIPANSRPELVAACQRICDDELGWEAILVESQDWVRPHTWQRRVTQLLQAAGYLSGDFTDHAGPLPEIKW